MANNADKHTEVLRFDYAKLGSSIQKTPQGFLKIPAYLSRSGIFTYQRADGTEVKEYRPPEEVFNLDSLATIANAPITDLHPEEAGIPVLVQPSNAKTFTVGIVGEDVKRDGNFIAATLTVMDQSMIDSILAGARKEISVGYSCAIDETPGVIDGQRYDCVQRNIVGNHVALGPKNWGRAGNEVALRMDSKSAVLKLDHIYSSEEVTVENKETLEKESAAAVNKTTVETKEVLEGLKERLDSILKELAEEKSKRLDAEKEKIVITDDANKMAKLMYKAMMVLGEDFDMSGMSTNDIMSAVIKQMAPDLMVDGESEDYMRGVFDVLVRKSKGNATVEEEYLDSSKEKLPQEEINEPKDPRMDSSTNSNVSSLGNARAIIQQANLSNARADSKASREKFLNWSQNAWKEKLAFSKN